MDYVGWLPIQGLPFIFPPEETRPNMNAYETIEQTGDRSIKRLAVLSCGYLFFAMGLIGAVLPVLPSTVFWILAAICFARSSPRMYQRILTLYQAALNETHAGDSQIS